MTIALALSSLSSPAAAQDDDPGRAEFVEGARAASEGRLADALPRFERAYELGNNPAALFNVGAALAGLGRFREAVAAVDRLLDAHPDLAPDLRVRAETLRRDARTRLARLALVGLAPSDDASIDGRPVAPRGEPPTVTVDPGPHELLVARAEHAPFSWRGALGEGELRLVEIAPERLEGPGDDTLMAVLVGVAAAVGIAAIALGAWLGHEAAQLDPIHERVLRP